MQRSLRYDAQSMIQKGKKKMINWSFIKIKNACSLKDTTERMKRQATSWGRKYLQITYLIKALSPK